MGEFGSVLISWYHKNKRTLPWRNTNDPFKIWLSEIILQQTRVDQGLAYYLKFLNKYPDIFALAAAPNDEVLKLWQGLGYYNRANNLMVAAKTIVDDYNGVFPQRPVELMKIKGIGKYTSAAIASIAFQEPIAVVDGNVYRLLSRVFGIYTPIDTGPAYRKFEALAKELMADHPPSTFNQALMEFGALYCIPKKPDCERCIFSANCFAKKNNTVSKLPVKKSKTTVKNRYLNYFVIETREEQPGILLHKRAANDIWKNLYDFPVLDTYTKIDPLESWSDDEVLSELLANGFHVSHTSKTYLHQLTHRKVHATFFHIIVDKLAIRKLRNSLLLIQKNEIINYPVPRLVEKYLQDQGII